MSGQLLSSKVILYETDPGLVIGAQTPGTVVGAVGITERGPIGVPVLCTAADVQRIFGGFTQNSDLRLALKGFFENGGNTVWVVRTVHYEDITDADSQTAIRATGELISDVPVILVEGKDPGAYGNRLEIETRAPTSGEDGLFDLLVIEDGTYRERYPNLSMESDAERYIETVINHEKTGSNFIRVADLEVPDSIPIAQTVSLTGGDDGLEDIDDSDFIGSEVGKNGIHALDHVLDLSMLMVPGRATPAVHNAMVAYCEVTRDGSVFPILDPPENMSATEIVEYLQVTAGLLNLSEYGAIYWPRVEVVNPAKSVFGNVDRIIVPPSGIVCGVAVRSDSARPGGIYDPPAGVDNGRMFGVLGFENEEVLEEAKRDLVYPKRINPLTSDVGMPPFIDGARTLKSGGNFPYIGERRGVIFIKGEIRRLVQFARHKNNTEGLREQVRRTITAFLMTQMNNGAFRSRDPEQAFFVDVSDELNTPVSILEGKLLARVGLATNKSVDWVVISVSQDLRAVETLLAAS